MAHWNQHQGFSGLVPFKHLSHAGFWPLFHDLDNNMCPMPKSQDSRWPPFLSSGWNDWPNNQGLSACDLACHCQSPFGCCKRRFWITLCNYASTPYLVDVADALCLHPSQGVCSEPEQCPVPLENHPVSGLSLAPLWLFSSTPCYHEDLSFVQPCSKTWQY